MRAIKHPQDKCPLGTAGTESCRSQLKGQRCKAGVEHRPRSPKTTRSPSLGTSKCRALQPGLLRGVRAFPPAEGCRSCPQRGLRLLQQLNPRSWKGSPLLPLTCSSTVSGGMGEALSSIQAQPNCLSISASQNHSPGVQCPTGLGCEGLRGSPGPCPLSIGHGELQVMLNQHSLKEPALGAEQNLTGSCLAP